MALHSTPLHCLLACVQFVVFLLTGAQCSSDVVHSDAVWRRGSQRDSTEMYSSLNLGTLYQHLPNCWLIRPIFQLTTILLRTPNKYEFTLLIKSSTNKLYIRRRNFPDSRHVDRLLAKSSNYLCTVLEEIFFRDFKVPFIILLVSELFHTPWGFADSSLGTTPCYLS